MSHDRGLIEHTGVVIAALTYLIVLPLITYIICTHFFSPRIYALWISTFNEDWNGSYSSHSFMWRFLEFNNWLAMKEKYYRLLLWRLVGGCSSKKYIIWIRVIIYSSSYFDLSSSNRMSLRRSRSARIAFLSVTVSFSQIW
jgi:hypothetical protein